MSGILWLPAWAQALGTGPWPPAFMAMAVGVIVGIALWSRLPAAAPSVAPGTWAKADLEEAYAHAIDHLRELDERATKMDAAFVGQERQRMELRAADLLQRLDAFAEPTFVPPPKPAAPGGLTAWLRARPQLQGALWGTGATALAAFLYVTVSLGSVPRPGLPVAAPAEAGPAGLQIDRAELAQLETRIKANPNDVPALLQLAHALLRGQMLEEARVLNDRALQQEPNNLEALTHAAVLLASGGDAASGLMGLKMVLNKDPGFAEAWFFRGMLSMQAGDTPTMQESFAQFIRYAPDGPQKERVRSMLERSRT